MADPAGGLQGAADRIRETAKWLTVSLAAVGGILVAGTQLSDVGALEAGSHRFWLAVTGAVLAGLGAVVMLLCAGWAMTTPSVSLQSVATKAPWGTEAVLGDATLLAGRADVAALKEEYLSALADRNTATRKHHADPADPALLTGARIADARAVEVNGVAEELLKVVSYEYLARRWRIAEAGIVVAGLIAGAGIGLFSWSANPPEDAEGSSATPNVLTTPAVQVLRLTPDGAQNLRAALGPGCDTGQPISVLVLARTEAGPDLVVDRTPGCARIRFVLGSTWGTVSPT